MINWLLIRKWLFQQLEASITSFESSYQEVFIELMELLKAKNYKVDDTVKQKVREILDENEKFIRTFLEGSIIQTTIKVGKSSKFADKLKEEIFNYKYPDGLTLSERLWKNKKEAEKEFFKVLKKQLKLRQSAMKTAYEIQKHMERKAGKKFAKLTKEEIKLIEKLRNSAKAMIKGKISKEKWKKILKQYQNYIKKRKESPYGVKNAHEQLLKNLTKAVDEASLQAVDEAVKWYMYDKQLYNIRRITRTETSNIYHQMVIQSYKDNEFLKGYKWKLSPAHKIKDICDEYANVDFGLGKGVWPKDKVPQRKPHPHCTCIIEPVFK